MCALAEYFPYARIVGLDIAEKKLELPPRITVMQGSQTDPATLDRLTTDYGPFDIIIDDGSHIVEHVITSFVYLYPRMRSDGIYIVEDTQTCFMRTFGGNPTGTRTIFDVAHRVSLAMHRLEGYVSATDEHADIDSFGAFTKAVTIHRNLVIFCRGQNTYPSNFDLSFENAEVQAVYDAMVNENKLNPAPRGYLSAVNMNVWGHRNEVAVELAMEAAELYPNDFGLLDELLRMMIIVKNNNAAAALKRKIAALSSKHPAVT